MTNFQLHFTIRAKVKPLLSNLSTLGFCDYITIFQFFHDVYCRIILRMKYGSLCGLKNAENAGKIQHCLLCMTSFYTSKNASEKNVKSLCLE